MIKLKSISLIVPVFNNESTLLEELNSCEMILKRNAKKYEIIVGDDKSSDNSRKILSSNFGGKKHFKLIFNSKNLGIAKNIYSLYRKTMLEYVIFYSVDGDWKTRDLEKMILKIKSSNSDIVIGKRTKKLGYNFYRRFVSIMYNSLPKLLFNVDLVDAGSIKILRREIIFKYNLKSNSVFIEAELLIRALKSGYRLEFVPVSYKKPAGKSGYAGNLKLAILAFYDLLKLRFSL